MFLTIMGMQSKTTLRFHLTAVGVAMNWQLATNTDRDVREMDSPSLLLGL